MRMVAIMREIMVLFDDGGRGEGVGDSADTDSTDGDLDGHDDDGYGGSMVMMMMVKRMAMREMVMWGLMVMMAGTVILLLRPSVLQLTINQIAYLYDHCMILIKVHLWPAF